MSKSDIYTTGDSAGVSPELQMLRLASGHLAAQAVHVFAHLGVADLLGRGRATAPELAEQLSADQDAFGRLMRFLATIGVVEEEEGGQFSLTALGRTLRSKPSSLIRDNTLLVSSHYYWTGIGGMLHQVMTGQNAFERAFGSDFFSYLSTHEAESRLFGSAMSSAANAGVQAVLKTCDLSAAGTVMDVGGGRGALIQGILKKYSGVQGVLYDLDTSIEQSLHDAATAARLKKVAGSFLEGVPGGADVYILRRILHDWNDEKALQILRNCRSAMRPGNRLVVIELLDRNSRNNWAGLDLLMMLMMDGRERTPPEVNALLAAAGFTPVSVAEADSQYVIIEARA